MSPTLNAPIAMGVVPHGPERMGEVLEFPVEGQETHTRRGSSIRSFYDKEGEPREWLEALARIADRRVLA